MIVTLIAAMGAYLIKEISQGAFRQSSSNSQNDDKNEEE